MLAAAKTGFPKNQKNQDSTYAGLFRSDDREGSHVVAYVFDAALSDLLGLTEWSTHGDDRALVLFDPCLPRGHSLPLLCAPFRFGKGVPCHHFWAGFVATENSEIGIVGAHADSFPLWSCGLEQSS